MRRLSPWGSGAAAAGVVAATVATVVLLAGSTHHRGHAPSTSRPAPPAPPGARSLDFRNALRVPPLLAPQPDAQGRKVFDLTLETGTSTFLPGTTTATWGANGAYLGPTLRASRGDTVLVHVHNSLPAVTTLHWHGMHLPAVDDGGPHQPIAPGDTWSPSWTIDQPAATLWYHPHPDGQTADQVYRGIAGVFIIDDPQAGALPLPNDYGVNDIPLVIQDKRIKPDGSLDFFDGPPGRDGAVVFTNTGRLGQTILVNGTYNPHLTVGAERVRLRLLNASDARVYNLGFADGRPFDLVATDEGLVEHPVPLRRLQLAPAERAEIVVTFHAGEQVVLHSFPPDLGNNPFGHGLNGDGESFDVIQFRAAAALRPAPALPAQLTTLAPLNLPAATRPRHFVLQHSNQINNVSMDMNRVDAVVIAGSTEIWEVNGFIPHDFHIHGVSFRVIQYGDGAVPPQLEGWKDTVFVPPFTTVRLLVQFGDYADPHHPYMYHCHIMQHEDNGMMGQFVVITRGQERQVAVNDGGG